MRRTHADVGERSGTQPKGAGSPSHRATLARAPQPGPTLKAATVFWHFARGMALAAKGKPDQAQADYQVVADAEKNTPEDVIFALPVNNKTKDILKIAKNVLGAQLAITRKDMNAGIQNLRDAVAIQDGLHYNEPADWFFPVRESLGAALLKNGDASAAEKVFREDLERTPRNPRSLWGLHQALLQQHRNYDAGFIKSQFEASWKGGTSQLKLDDLV